MSETRLLTAEELAAIRERVPLATEMVPDRRMSTLAGANMDALALLAHIDALTERLEAAERVVAAARAYIVRGLPPPRGASLVRWSREGATTGESVRQALAAYDAARSE